MYWEILGIFHIWVNFPFIVHIGAFVRQKKYPNKELVPELADEPFMWLCQSLLWFACEECVRLRPCRWWAQRTASWTLTIPPQDTRTLRSQLPPMLKWLMKPSKKQQCRCRGWRVVGVGFFFFFLVSDWVQILHSEENEKPFSAWVYFRLSAMRFQAGVHALEPHSVKQSSKCLVSNLSLHSAPRNTENEVVASRRESLK